ncbi:MAG: sigma factor [Solirubrobacteraceae bacterium]
MDDERFRELLLGELPRLLRLVRRLTPPGVDAEDLTQDVVERAWRSRSSYRAGALASTWLHAQRSGLSRPNACRRNC